MEVIHTLWKEEEEKEKKKKDEEEIQIASPNKWLIREIISSQFQVCQEFYFKHQSQGNISANPFCVWYFYLHFGKFLISSKDS